MLESILTNEQINDVEAAISVFPNYEAKILGFVDGYDEIIANDIVTVKLEVKRINLKDKKKEIGFPHSNTNIDIYEEKAAILVLQDGRLIYNAVVSH